MSREAPIKALCEAGDISAATTRALQLYGGEVFGLLVALHRNEQDASDVFSAWSERLWQSMDGFGWECSLRTWSYMLARQASSRFRREGRRHDDGRIGLSEAISNVAAEVRSATATYLRTETKDEIARLRESLPDDDQMLLILRVDRGLEWDEVTRVFLGDDADDAASHKRESARLRKRFQLVKERLLELGRARGLTASRDS